MVMKSKIIEVKNGYIPGDPNAIASNLEFTRSEDDPHPPVNIVPYEGWNFLPTDYGYRSYFGTNAVLNISVLPSRCDALLIIQSDAFINIAVALCEDGIWTANPGTPGFVWFHVVTYTFDADVHRMWTDVRIDNKSYFYQEGRPSVHRLSELNVLDSFVPTFLNMPGQIGIFQAGGRLGFWDSLNSVSWSNIFNYEDFTPSLETLAGNAKFNSVLGEIITIKKHGDGFIIYASKSITTVHQSLTTTGLNWDAVPVATTAGVRHEGEITVGTSDSEHYVYTTQGLIIIKAFNSFMKQHEITNGLTPVTDFLRENKDPIFIEMMQGRYLFFCMINPNYIDGIRSSYEVTQEEVGAVQVYFRDGSFCILRDGSNVYFSGESSFPSSSFNLDTGALLPSYPRFTGALVYDTIFQKWGKFAGNFTLLVELNPENAVETAVAGYTDFGMSVGILQETGVIRLFDNKPVESFLRWGKIGYSRMGFTSLFEATMQFRSNSSGTLEIESSLNGRDLKADLKRMTPFTNTRTVTHKSTLAARWHTIAVRGQWDLQYAEFRGKMSGIR